MVLKRAVRNTHDSITVSRHRVIVDKQQDLVRGQVTDVVETEVRLGP